MSRGRLSGSGVAVGAEGSVYVSEFYGHRLQQLSAGGEPLAVWAEEGHAPGELLYPSKVAVASDGTVYVADAHNHRIQRFGAHGELLGAWGSSGSWIGQLQDPVDVAIDASGRRRTRAPSRAASWAS